MQRLFFALWPKDILRQHFVKIRQSYLENAKAKPVNPNNLHITLAFLGNISESQRTCFEESANSLQFKPFQIQLDQLGYWRRPQILWLGNSTHCEPLQQLVKSLNEKLVICGFKPETRPYKAHVTLVRKYHSRQFQPATISPIIWTVEDIHLVESVNSPTGVQYKILRTWTGNA